MLPMNRRNSLSTLKNVWRWRSFKFGLPFLLLMVGGSFGLREFTQIRYTYAKKQLVNPADMKKYGINMKEQKDVTLESEFEKIKEIDIDDWENIRGPRPWEEKQ